MRTVLTEKGTGFMNVACTFIAISEKYLEKSNILFLVFVNFKIHAISTIYRVLAVWSTREGYWK